MAGVTENLPNVPQAYQPPATPPAGPYEPPVTAPGKRSNATAFRLVVVVFVLILTFGGSFVVGLTKPADMLDREEAAPAPAVRPSWAELTALPPSAEATAEDATDGAPTWIRFTNETAGTVTVWWLDYDSQRVRYADLPAGRGYDQQTYAGHVWVLTRPDGAAIALYRATPAPALAVIR